VYYFTKMSEPHFIKFVENYVKKEKGLNTFLVFEY
jgi:hypothetical protein